MTYEVFAIHGCIDACVLYPAALRDLLMWLGLSGLYRERWIGQIYKDLNVTCPEYSGVTSCQCIKRFGCG